MGLLAITILASMLCAYFILGLIIAGKMIKLLEERVELLLDQLDWAEEKFEQHKRNKGAE